MSREYRFSFRLDDITEDMNWANFRRIKELFDKYGIRPLIGIVPDNRDPKLKVDTPAPEFWNIMSELSLQGWTIAQHGFQHIYETSDSGMLGLKAASEFAGVSESKQKEKLLQGKNILKEHGIESDVFMAPGHTYDVNTLKVLKELGFHYITDGYADCCYQRNGLIFIPCKSVRKPSQRGTDTICLHLNSMQERQFQELETLLREKRRYVVDFKELQKCRCLKYGIRIRCQEYRNLKWKKIKLWAAAEPLVQEYLQERRLAFRLLGIPKLCMRLLVRRS